jgi:hypothetical protein
MLRLGLVLGIVLLGLLLLIDHNRWVDNTKERFAGKHHNRWVGGVDSRTQDLIDSQDPPVYELRNQELSTLECAFKRGERIALFDDATCS